MIGVLAFLSGAAGLVYEVAWARRLAQLCGGTAAAQALTMALFLGGLAAGSARLGRRAGAGRAALAYYARLEWLVAVSGLAAPAALWLADRAGAGWAAAAALAAQAFLMGGAVPALCGALGGEAQSGIGRVYAANSAGAVAGALAAGAALIPRLGLTGSFGVAAALNAAAALAASGARAAAAAAEPSPQRAGPAPSIEPALALVVLFVSGFVALAYEVAWTRLLTLCLGSSAYSFAEMLAAMIAGLAAGSALAASARLRRVEPAVLLAAAELGAGAAVLVTLPLYDRLPVWFLQLRPHFPATTAGFYELEAAKLGICLALLALPTACLGAAFPAAARLWENGERGRAEGTGAALAASTAGNVLGALAGLWALPWLGLEGLLRAGTTVHLAAGAAVALAARPLVTPRRRLAAAAGVALFLAARAALPRWNLLPLAVGLYRAQLPHAMTDPRAVYAALEDSRLIFHRDDREATVSVTSLGASTEAVLSLHVNGKVDASTGPDMTTQILLGQVPLLLRPGARRALLIGWGSGVTAGSMLTHPLEALDAVELVPAVVTASRLFDERNGRPLADPRLRLRLEDARSFLRRAGPSYDVIVSEPSNPWMAGVSDLFSREFYARARARLAQGGLMLQWMHAYEMDDETLALALRTFCAEFPETTLWTDPGGDLMLVGSDRPLAPDWAAVERSYRREAVWRDLRRAGALYPATVLSLQRMGDSTLRRLVGAGPVNREDRPLLEYSAPIAFFRNDRARAFVALDDRLDPRRARALALGGYEAWRGGTLRSGEFIDMLSLPRSLADRPVVTSLLRRWAAAYPADARPRRMLRELLRTAAR